MKKLCLRVVAATITAGRKVCHAIFVTPRGIASRNARWLDVTTFNESLDKNWNNTAKIALKRWFTRRPLSRVIAGRSWIQRRNWWSHVEGIFYSDRGDVIFITFLSIDLELILRSSVVTDFSCYFRVIYFGIDRRLKSKLRGIFFQKN